ncbi:MAG TPA: DUF2953 domain-containing protein, partial [Lachnospiraceae bacterium]|nr:DUF2953 domain-containing protein [Lachnospiraceae bacterium]
KEAGAAKENSKTKEAGGSEYDEKTEKAAEDKEKEEKEDGTGRNTNLLLRFLRFVWSFFTHIFGIFKKLVRFVIRIAVGIFHLPGQILSAVGKIVAKIKAVCAKIDKWKTFLSDERTHETLKLALKKIKKLFGHVKPRKLSGNISFGLDDPSKTGDILAAVSMFYPIYGKNLVLNPDFNRKVFEGQIEMSGRIYLFYVAYVALTLLLNKNTKFVIGFFKNIKEEEE